MARASPLQLREEALTGAWVDGWWSGRRQGGRMAEEERKAEQGWPGPLPCSFSATRRTPSPPQLIGCELRVYLTVGLRILRVLLLLVALIQSNLVQLNVFDGVHRPYASLPVVSPICLFLVQRLFCVAYTDQAGHVIFSLLLYSAYGYYTPAVRHIF